MINTYQIIVDPGHGGSEPGAQANNYQEKNVNLQLALKVVPLLQKYFSNVIMTRNADTYFDVDSRASWVAQKAAAFDGKTICLSLHFNAFDTKACGAETIYSIHSEPDLAKAIVKRIVELGISYRDVYCKAGTYDKDSDYYAMHRLTGRAQTIIVESLFLDNTGDIQFLQKPNFLDDLAGKIVTGLIDYVQPQPAQTSEPVQQEVQPQPVAQEPNQFKADNDALLAAGILHNDHTAQLNDNATIGFVCALINRAIKYKEEK